MIEKKSRFISLDRKTRHKRTTRYQRRRDPKGVTFWDGAIDWAVSLGIYYAIEVSAQCLFNFDADELGPGVNYGRDMPMAADYGNGPFVAVNCAFLQARPVFP